MIEVREIRADEHAAAAEVTVEGYRSFYREGLGDYADRLRNIEARTRDAVVLVAIADETIAGTVTYVPNPASPYAEKLRAGEASVRMLSVAPGYQRRGIGRTLSVACIERARAEGKRAVVLHADEPMTASRHLYETLGFERDPGRDYSPDGETLLVCYVLEL